MKSLFSLNLIRFSSDIKAKMVKAVVILAPGAEEVEFIGSVDLLRRANVRFSYYLKCAIFLID